MTPNFKFDLESLGDLDKQFYKFLNEGGSRRSVIAAYLKQYPWANRRTIQERDVTADGVPELLYTRAGGYFYVYICKDGLYEVKTPLTETYHFTQPFIIKIQDMNLDGEDEIITISGDDRVRIVDVFEWNGSDFQRLNRESPQSDRPCSIMYGPSWFDILDTDGNGTLELILKQTIPIWSEYVEGLPWRKETRTCTWNGESFVFTRTEFSPPKYRFQAVQDGDQAALLGEYDRAIDRYRQAIFSDQLQWWSFDRKMYETQLALDKNLPPQLPPDPDPNEYYYLAAYARFRIMLLHIVRGYLSDAKIVYDSLQAKFPNGQPGHEFAEMATLFWDEYQTSFDIGSACRRAIEHAIAHPNILTYLGSSYHGWQSHTYIPEDVCPFTASP